MLSTCAELNVVPFEIYLIAILKTFLFTKIKIEMHPQTHCSKQVNDMKSSAVSHAQMA